MSESLLKTKRYYWISFTLFLLGVFSWVPYLIFNIQASYGMLTLVLNPIGFYLGALSKNRWIALGNLMMIFSIVLVLIFVYLKKGYIPM